jgi:hypothetical protein
MIVAFFVRHFTERGTEVAIYDYAHHNEAILANKSIVVCFSEGTQRQLGFPMDRVSYPKFAARFPIFEINSFDDMQGLIQREGIDVFYTLTSGEYEPMYKFSDKHIWGNCRTIKHCVFTTVGPESDCYAGISEYLNIKYKTSYPVLPHMIDLPPCTDNMRSELGIPNDAIVLGRHGGFTTFDLQMTKNAIRTFLRTESNVYFLFLNTRNFYDHPRILYLDVTTDAYQKSKFIQTCDAMIHGRSDGEIFPVSIGEFAVFNKPVITTYGIDSGHLFNLKDRAIVYRTEEELVHIFHTIDQHLQKHSDWNTYKEYTPRKVMEIFNSLLHALPAPVFLRGLPSCLKIKVRG